jgi:hypothetical protein
MVKFLKCVVTAKKIMIEEFDKKTGKPVVETKTDMYGNKYEETKQKIYRRGEEVSFPEKVVKKLKSSVEIVTAPVFEQPIEEEPEEPPEGKIKSNDKGETVADMIPKEESKTKSTTKKSTTSTKK